MKKIHQILINLQAEIAEREKVSRQFGGSWQDSWDKEKAYCWAYAASNYRLLTLSNLEAKPTPSAPAGLLAQAIPIYHKWRTTAQDLQKCKDIILNPKKDELMLDYLQRLYSSVIAKTKEKSTSAQPNIKKTKYWESLTSFLNMLREQLAPEERGYLNDLFPQKMTPYADTLIRLEPKTTYSISIWAVTRVIETLVNSILNGRKNTRSTHAHILGLLWTCLACARARVEIHVKQLHNLSIGHLLHVPNASYPDFSFFLRVKSSHGIDQIPISSFLHAYLAHLAQQNRQNGIFHPCLRTLQRQLAKTISQSSLASQLGKVTFLTFLSIPHTISSQHRYPGL